MREKEFISKIKSILNSNYIGDDCAYLPDLGIVITQDSLVEGVHFSLEYMTPYQLGYKSVMVNLSDVASSGAEPKYLTIALSLPANIDENFVEEFYQGAKEACGKGIQIVGGDITGADKVYVSVSAIGSTEFRKIASRKRELRVRKKPLLSYKKG
jgi:thiamine-monophosphate kinase